MKLCGEFNADAVLRHWSPKTFTKIDTASATIAMLTETMDVVVAQRNFPCSYSREASTDSNSGKFTTWRSAPGTLGGKSTKKKWMSDFPSGCPYLDSR